MSDCASMTAYIGENARVDMALNALNTPQRIAEALYACMLLQAPDALCIGATISVIWQSADGSEAIKLLTSQRAPRFSAGMNA